MSLKKLALSLAMAGMVSAGTASAATILTFGQSSGSNTITGNETAGTTTITGTNVGVVITQIDAATVTPVAAFLTLNMTSTAPAIVTGLPGDQDVSQTYSGSFSITSLAGGGGTNYLSGTFTDSVFGAIGGAGLTVQAAQPPDTVTFTSDVIANLAVARNISLSLTNVTPFVNVLNNSINDFTASISGNFSANNPVIVPEPAALLLLGTALAGLAIRRRRRA